MLPLRSPFVQARLRLLSPPAVHSTFAHPRSALAHCRQLIHNSSRARSYFATNSAKAHNHVHALARRRVQAAAHVPTYMGHQHQQQPLAFLAARASQMLVLTSASAGGLWLLSRTLPMYSRITHCDAFVTRSPIIEVGKLDQDDVEPADGKSKTPASKDVAAEEEVIVPKSNLMLLWQLLQNDRWLFAIAALSSVLSSLAVSAQARVIGAVFDLIGSSDPMAFMGSAQQLLGLFALQSALNFVASVSLAVATNRLGESLRCDFFAAILRQDIADFDETKSGELAHQLAQDISELQSSLRTAFTTGIGSVTGLIAGSVTLYMTSQKLALCMLGMLPLAAMSASLLGHTLRDLSLSVHHASNKTTGIATESIGAIRTVRAFAAEDRELGRYSASLGRVTELKQQMAVAAGAFYACLHLGINCSSLLICGYGGFLVSTGELTKGGIAAAVTQVQSLERDMGKLSILAAKWSKAVKASEHIFALIDKKPLVNRNDLGVCLRNPVGEVKFHNVRFAYPSRPERTVLDDFSLECKPGQVVALVGPSGSGKSTVMGLLERFYDVDAGKVTFDGVDLRDLNPKWLHGVIGVVSQEPALFAGSVRENIRFGRPEASDEEVEWAAKQANAHAFVSDFPEGYDTELGERGVLLSGGQKQRLAIARCLLLNPTVLILDEATSALDAESEHLVQQALEGLMHGRTTIVIAHRLSTIRNANNICVLENGQLLEQGTHDQLMKQLDGTYRALFQRQHAKRE